VDENEDVDAGVRVAAAFCVAGVRKRDAAALKGRNAGRKDERFIVLSGVVSDDAGGRVNGC
jgi:hypothetical protein